MNNPMPSGCLLGPGTDANGAGREHHRTLRSMMSGLFIWKIAIITDGGQLRKESSRIGSERSHRDLTESR